LIRRIPAAAVLLLAVAVTACADEAGAPDEVGVDGGQSQGLGSASRPPMPELGEGVREIGGKLITLAPSPGLVATLTPYDLQLAAGEQRPPCDRFVFAFGWQVVDPAEPRADFQLGWTFDGGGGPQEIGRGARGTAKVGCGVIKISNETGEDISVDIHYLLGAAP